MSAARSLVLWAGSLALASLPACSAPALDPHLARAEAAAAAGDPDAALRHYQAATVSCQAESNPRVRRVHCASAHLGRAELLARLGRLQDAARAYERIPEILDDDPASAAEGVYRAGRLYLELGEDERAYTLLWRTITDYPEQGFAADALKTVIRDGRRRNPAQLYEVLGSLVQPLAGTGVGDNLLYALADLAENDLDDPRAALAFHDKLIAEYPTSGIRDDAFWHAARLARQLGDPRGAAARLRALLATREVAIGAGSYNSVRFDNALLELGRVLRDDMGDLDGALAAFARLPHDYPTSTLRDDALWETARTWAARGDRKRTCASLARLAKEWPDSKYQLQLAPALRQKYACP